MGTNTYFDQSGNFFFSVTRIVQNSPQRGVFYATKITSVLGVKVTQKGLLHGSEEVFSFLRSA